MMKYRVRIDMSFKKESEALVLLNAAKDCAVRAVSLNENQDKTVPSSYELELCRHDEGMPCTRLEKVEVGGGEQ